MNLFVGLAAIVFITILVSLYKSWVGTKLGDVIIIFIGICMMYGAASIANDLFLWLKG